MSRRTRWSARRIVTGIALVAGAGAALAACGSSSAAVGAAPACGSGSPRLTVTGRGSATATPTLLTLSMAVSTSGSSASGALTADETTATAVIAALRSGGVGNKDIQTTDLAIGPSYSSTGAVTGYSTTESVVAKIHHLATAGSVIDAAAGAAGNAVRISSMRFSVTDPRHMQDRARADAVQQAVSHAAVMAAAAGERLGPICSLTDTSSAPSPVFAGGAAARAHAPSAPRVPLEPGSQQATARVRLVYSLEPATRAA